MGFDRVTSAFRSPLGYYFPSGSGHMFRDGELVREGLVDSVELLLGRSGVLQDYVGPLVFPVGGSRDARNQSGLGLFDESSLVIHVRGGDVFKSGEVHSGYAQPPLVFYRDIINSRSWGRVYVVSGLGELSRNPCVLGSVVEFGELVTVVRSGGVLSVFR